MIHDDAKHDDPRLISLAALKNPQGVHGRDSDEFRAEGCGFIVDFLVPLIGIFLNGSLCNRNWLTALDGRAFFNHLFAPRGWVFCAVCSHPLLEVTMGRRIWCMPINGAGWPNVCFAQAVDGVA